MITASQPFTARITASAICAVVTTSTRSTPYGVASATGPQTSVTAAPRSRAASAIANPIFPEDRLPMNRTGSIGSCVPPALTTMRRPARSPCAPSACRNAPIISSVSTRRPGPTCPLASLPSTGPMKITPRRVSISMFACVAACAHICASIAGATSTGAVVASAVSATMLSAMPCASRAIVVALAGAMSSASAARASATCSSASSDCGSYMSVNTGRPVRARNVSGEMNFCAASVRITSTSASACVSLLARSAAL